MTGPLSAPARASDLVALHGDTWDTCPWFVFAVGGVAVEGWPDNWSIHAELRSTRADPHPLIEWRADHGDTAGTGILTDGAEVTLKSGRTLELPAITLRLAPQDWQGKPADWVGFLGIEVVRGPLDNPVDRRTVVKRRRFRIVSDLVP